MPTIGPMKTSIGIPLFIADGSKTGMMVEMHQSTIQTKWSIL
jgi:hypothetical protein